METVGEMNSIKGSRGCEFNLPHVGITDAEPVSGDIKAQLINSWNN